MIETVIKCLPKRKWYQSRKDYFECIDVEVRGYCVSVPKEFSVPARIVDVKTSLAAQSGIEGYVQFTLDVQTVSDSMCPTSEGEKS